MKNLRDILEEYYFVKWDDVDECVDTLTPKLIALFHSVVPEKTVIDPNAKLPDYSSQLENLLIDKTHRNIDKLGEKV